jgi:hypothetical protein
MRHKRKQEFTRENNTAADILSLIKKFKPATPEKSDVPFADEFQDTMDTF